MRALEGARKISVYSTPEKDVIGVADEDAEHDAGDCDEEWAWVQSIRI